jgi:hypothetical protein
VTDLLALAVRVREQSGRPLDAAGLERLRKKISAYTPSEATEAKTMLRRLLDHAAKMPTRVDADQH